MKITSLRISNFRGIKYAHTSDLGSTVIIAGQNGSGKSCLFDAIRLLKSVYGGYQQNEWQHWLGEFQINVNARGEDLLKIFNDPMKQLSIECTFELDDREKAFINNNASKLVEDYVWRTILPEAFQYGGIRAAMFSSQFREREEEVLERVQNTLPDVTAELAQVHAIGAITVEPGQRLQIRPSQLLPIIFNAYRPNELGVIDYHGAQRHYGREVVQNLNISLDQTEQNQGAHALYNYANKYNNVKSEMASAYVKEILAEKAGIPLASQSTLTDTLKELFETFFPDKKFLGPTPTREGHLTFPVRTPTGSIHDLDDLSSGEKEILYGYLRIRNSAPRFSIILLDEPELHLNPRLIRGLPQFYRKHLGEKLQNQIWLVSHSDALLREAVGKAGFNIFHMQPAASLGDVGEVATNVNQLRPLNIERDLDLALTDLIGDLAAYQPGRKGVIFEGGGDSDFDQWMTSRLFPELAAQANLISGSNKHKVRALHDVLERAFDKGQLHTKFFAIVDGDFEGSSAEKAINRFAWDVYHIENYLLEDRLIADTVLTLRAHSPFSPEDALDALKRAARAIVPNIVRRKLSDYVNNLIVKSINIGADPAADDVSAAIDATVQNSVDRISVLRSSSLTLTSIEEKRTELQTKIEHSFSTGSWRKELPGRDILKRFVTQENLGVQYSLFRNMLVNRLADGSEERPIGMKSVVDKILTAK